MTTIPFGPQLIGRTEKALNALLERELSGTGVAERQWVALNLTDGALPSDRLAARISEALRIDAAAARELLAELIAAGLVHEAAARTIELTGKGRSLQRGIRSATASLTEDLWGDLPDDDRATAARVLNVVLTRAGAALSSR